MLAHARPSHCALMVAAAAHMFELPPAFALPFPQPALNVQLYHPCPRNAEVLILHPRSLSYPGSQLDTPYAEQLNGRTKTEVEGNNAHFPYAFVLLSWWNNFVDLQLRAF